MLQMAVKGNIGNECNETARSKAEHILQIGITLQIKGVKKIPNPFVGSGFCFYSMEQFKMECATKHHSFRITTLGKLWLKNCK